MKNAVIVEKKVFEQCSNSVLKRLHRLQKIFRQFKSKFWNASIANGCIDGTRFLWWFSME